MAEEGRKTRKVRLINLDKAPPRRAVQAALKLRRALQAAADALVPPEVAAYETSISFFRTRVAGALAEVGVIDAIGDGRRDAADLAAELGLHADTLHRTLRLAAAQGLAEVDGERAVRADGDRARLPLDELADDGALGPARQHRGRAERLGGAAGDAPHRRPLLPGGPRQVDLAALRGEPRGGAPVRELDAAS